MKPVSLIESLLPDEARPLRAMQAALPGTGYQASNRRSAFSAAQQPASYQMKLAQTTAEIREAQALRARVFAAEYGLKLPPAMAIGQTPGRRLPLLDVDMFDAYCEHLIVRDTRCGEVVGTYRLLTPQAAQRVGQYYSESLFFINRLEGIRGGLLELGRACVAPEHRQGSVIMLLWAGIAQRLQALGCTHLIGCASVSLRDGGLAASQLAQALRQVPAADAALTVFPKRRYQPLMDADLARLGDDVKSLRAATPPLLRAYLKAGAVICGDPAWDPEFNTADFPILLQADVLSGRHARHFGLAGDARRPN